MEIACAEHRDDDKQICVPFWGSFWLNAWILENGK